jgi:hypothetical protein
MESQSIVISSRQSDFTTNFTPPIKLDKNKYHEIALIGLDMYHSIPNIDESNNKFYYEIDGVENTITIPIGCYEIESINAFIQKILPNLIEIRANTNTLKCVIVIKSPSITINFNKPNSLKTLLGFGDITLKGIGEYESTNIVNIMSINSILVHCSSINGSYLNSSLQNIIYTFFPNVPPGYKIVKNPNTPIYLSVYQPMLYEMRIWLTDQDRNILNTRGEEITIRLHLRSRN